MSINDITFKDVDGTTDVVYEAVQGSSGDNSPAVYRLVVSDRTVPLNQIPTFQIGVKSNGPKTGRRLTTDYASPIMQGDLLTSALKVVGKTPGTHSILLPLSLSPQAATRESHHFAMLNASQAVRNAAATGYAPRF